MTFRYGCSFGTRLDMFALFLQSILFGTVCSLFLETANFVESNNDHTEFFMLHHTLVGISSCLIVNWVQIMELQVETLLKHFSLLEK